MTEDIFSVVSSNQTALIEKMIAMFPTVKSPQKSCRNPFAQLPSEIIIQIFSYLGISDLSSISRTCKSFKDISESDVLWNKYFGIVSSSCNESYKWRYQLDAKNTVSKCCYKSKGNFKQCFYNDQLPAMVCEEKRKDHENEWLKKAKFLHDLPQLQISCVLVCLFVILVSLKLNSRFDFSWFLVFTPLWILSLLFWASLGTAYLTKRHFPHLLYRLDRGLFYRTIMKEVTQSTNEPESGVRRNDPIRNFRYKRSATRVWYSALLQAQCICAYFFVTFKNNLTMLMSCVPFLFVIASYNYQMMTCNRAPKGSRMGLVLAWMSVPVFNFLSTLSSNAITALTRAELLGLCIIAVSLVIYNIWRLHPNNCWKSIKYRENFISGWCLGNCLAGSFMFGLFLWLKLNLFVSWSYFTVLTPVWIVNAYLITLTLILFIYPSVFRLSECERNACILGNLFLLLPCFAFEIWFCFRMENLTSMTLLSCLICLVAIETVSFIIASKSRLIRPM